MNTFDYFRIEKSSPTDIISTSDYVYHMDLDRYRPGFIVYTEKPALMTSDGTTTHLIAGNSTQYGYREGVGAEARFSYNKGLEDRKSTRLNSSHVKRSRMPSSA